MPVTGSQWFDNSANANKLRNSYLKGFLDISGGGISIRNATGANEGTALNFYDDNTSVAKVRLDADKIRVAAPAANYGVDWFNNVAVNTVNGGAQIDISMQAIGYLSGISRNIERSLQHLHDIVDAGEQTFGDVSANTVAVVSDATIGGRLYVNGDINGNGNLSIAKNAYVGGNLDVVGNATIQADFYVKGNSHLDGDVYLKDDLHLYNGNVYAYKNLTASGDIFAGEDLYVKQTINVSGDASMNSRLIVGGDVSFNTHLRVGGDISANGTIYCNKIVVVSDVSDNGSMEVATDFEVSGTAFINGDVSLNSTLNVAGDASFNKIIVHGDASLNSTLHLSGAATFNDIFTLAGAAILSSTLDVTAKATLSDDLEVAKATILSSTLDVDGAATLNSTLDVDGAATLNSTLNVTAAATLSSTLNVTAAATLSSTLDVTAAAKLASTLDVAGDSSLNVLAVHKAATLNSTLDVMKAVTLSSTLNVAEDATFTKHIGVNDISAGRFQTGKLIMEDQYNGVNYENYIRSTAGDISIRAGDAAGAPYGNVIIKSNLIVDGSINFSGTITQTDIKIQVSDQLDISANNTGYEALKVTQHASTGAVATFYNNVYDSATPVFVVGYNHVAINKTIAEESYEFDVSGDAQISGNLYIGGAVEFDTTLTVNGDYSSAAGNLTLTAGDLTLTSGDLTVTAGKITGATMEITSTSTFGGKVTMNAGLDLSMGLNMAAGTFINQIGAEVW